MSGSSSTPTRVEFACSAACGNSGGYSLGRRKNERRMNKDKRREIYLRLQAENPAPTTELEYRIALPTAGFRDPVGAGDGR